MNQRRRKKSQSRRGFTLMEVMLVLVIIAAIASIAVLNLGAFRTRAFQNTAKAEIATLKQAIESYSINVGTYPESLEALHTQPSNISDPSKWMQTLKEAPGNDPWEHPYEYKLNGDAYEIRSAGPDGQTGTEDDIVGVG